MPRHLVSTRRAVPQQRRSEYDQLWERVRSAAEAHGLHAWRFRAADGSDTFLEFLEAAGATALEHDDLSTALRELDRTGSGSTDHWEDAT